MTNSIANKKHNLAWYLCLAYYTMLNSIGFFVGNSKVGAVLIISLIVLLLFYYLFKNQLRIKLVKGQRYLLVYLLVFSSFCLISTKWAINKEYAFNQGINMFEISFATLVIYLLFQSRESIDDLLKIIMYGGLLFCLIVAVFYGPVGLIKLFAEGGRVSEIANANSLADYCLFSGLAALYLFVKYKKTIYFFLLFPIAFMTILAGSRKVFVALILASFLFFFFTSLGEKKKFKAFSKIVGVIILVGLGIFVASLIPSLHFVFVRVESMIDTFLGKDISDSSTMVRLNLQEIGLSIFKKHPYFGIGIDNAGIYGGKAYNVEKYYMHNNFVELLADIGIVGTLIYYSIYIVIFAKMMFHHDFKDSQFCIILTMLLIHVFLDLGNVSYIDKSTYIYLIPMWVKACNLNKNQKRLRHGTNPLLFNEVCK